MLFNIFMKTGHLQTSRLFFAFHRYFNESRTPADAGPIFLHTSPIGITEVNFGTRLLWVIEDQSHQKWVMKKKRLGTTALDTSIDPCRLHCATVAIWRNTSRVHCACTFSFATIPAFLLRLRINLLVVRIFSRIQSCANCERRLTFGRKRYSQLTPRSSSSPM